MKTLQNFINERKGALIDEQWLNDEKPVMTKDGRQAIITKIDFKQIPNIIIGKVKHEEELLEYEWDEKGNCTKALDQRDNPKQPEESDALVKAI